MESLMEAAESRKRLLEEEDNNTDHHNDKQTTTPYHLKQPPSVHKRRSVDVMTRTTFAAKSPCFLVFHFKMLKSLYDDEEEEDSSQVQEEDEETNDKQTASSSSAPDEKVWQAMQDFLKQRAKILQAQSDAKNSQGVHLAAMAHLGKASTLSSNQSSNNSVLMPGESSPDPIFRRKSHEQGTTHSPSILQSPLNKALHTSFNTMATASQTTHPRNPFRLVSVLLQKRAQTMQTQYQHVAAPYQDLHKCCLEQIQALTDQVQDLQHAVGQSTRSWRQQLVDTPKSPASSSRFLEQTEERQSALAATRAKLQLWKLLQRDLGQTMTSSD